MLMWFFFGLSTQNKMVASCHLQALEEISLFPISTRIIIIKPFLVKVLAIFTSIDFGCHGIVSPDTSLFPTSLYHKLSTKKKVAH